MRSSFVAPAAFSPVRRGAAKGWAIRMPGSPNLRRCLRLLSGNRERDREMPRGPRSVTLPG